ncbi:MAG: efflux RND transporter periplasmic adaptor subunit [Bacteroidia bacterium]|nr:efflux RND transporter periplasmic adaptor subunit [Bacteroidia bacterium]MDW8157267.1 efflux RND transporter periplasmic adaptor subunit [Bacteroidia bacterium]
MILLCCSSKLDDYIEVNGKLEVEEIWVRAPVKSKLKYFIALPGDTINEGKIIALLDTLPFHLQKKELQDQLQRFLAVFPSSKKVHSITTLLDKNITPEEMAVTVKQHPKQQIESLLSEIELLEEKIRNCFIHAPTKAIVIYHLVKEGDTVAINQALAKLSPFYYIIARAHLTQEQIAYAEEGKVIEIELQETPFQNVKLLGKIEKIESALNSVHSGLYSLKIVVPNPKRQLKAGMRVKIRLTAQNYPNIKVPTLAD